MILVWFSIHYLLLFKPSMPAAIAKFCGSESQKLVTTFVRKYTNVLNPPPSNFIKFQHYENAFYLLFPIHAQFHVRMRESIKEKEVPLYA